MLNRVSRWLALSLTVAFAVVTPRPASAASPNLVVSQVYGGGGNSGALFKNDFIEVFNRGASPVSLAGWSVQYASSTGTSWQVTLLSGSIAPGQYYLVQESAGAGGTTNLPTPDAIGSIAMSATAGKVVLVNGTTALSGICPSVSVVDAVGYDGANCFEGAAAAPALTNTTAALRASNGCADTDNNSVDFASGAPAPRNAASPLNPCSAPTSPGGAGASVPSSAEPGDAVRLTVAVTPGSNPTSTGMSVSGDLSPIGGSSTQPFFDDGTHGDSTAGDSVFSYQVTVAGGTAPGPRSLPFTVTDAQLRTGSGFIALTVASPTPSLAIHDIQGAGAASPYTGQSIKTTLSVVTALRSNGFFIQVPDGQEDGDPNTSEGVFVFTSSAPAVAVGDAVFVRGVVSEFIPKSDPSSPPTTEIVSPAITVSSSGNPLPLPVTLTAADTSPSGPIDQLEKYEGMRVHVDSLTVIAPTSGTVNEPTAISSSNGVFYGVITGLPRPFREPGIEVPDPLPPGSPCCVPRFDANPERLRVDSDAQPGSSGLDVTTGALVTNLTGPLDYSFRTYTILPDPATPPGVSGLHAAIPVPLPAAKEFTVGSFNLERFFDTVNDPGVSDVALTAEAFARRLNKASLAIREVMRSPDILGVEEMENLTTLQALAAKVNSDAVAGGGPDPAYQAYLEEGNDVGGIDSGFLVKSSRVTVIEVSQFGKDATYIPPGGSTALLNDRPPLLLRATVAPAAGPGFPITVIVNHLRSLSGVDDPIDGSRVRAKRRAQAEYLAGLVQSRQAANPEEHIVVVGDFNAFPFSDGYVDVLGTIEGKPTPSDQVVLASADLVNPDLTDLVETLPAAEQYSFSFDGNAQVLDHILITRNLLSLESRFAYARNDADFPESYRNDPNRPERVSDHDMPVAYFAFPEADLSVAAVASPLPAVSGTTVTLTLTVSNAGPGAATGVTLTDQIPSGLSLVSCTATGGGVCGGTATSPVVTFSSLAPWQSAVVTLTATLGCDLADGAALSNTATVAGGPFDPVPDNNTATTSITVSNPAPVISGAGVDRPVLSPPNHKMVPVTVRYATEDNCGSPVLCGLSVTSNEPENGQGDGNTAADWQVIDSHHVRLRAERSGAGAGRIYTIAIRCADPAGGVATSNVQVTVPH
ncbi:MAG: lamin tail domain-containing protein [Acidobacteriota bacterium]